MTIILSQILKLTILVAAVLSGSAYASPPKYKVKDIHAVEPQLFEVVDPQKGENDGSNLRFVSKLSYLPKDTPLYYWGTKDIIQRLAQSGLAQKDFDYYMNRPNMDAIGPGFYNGLDPITYVDFGEKLLVMKARKPVLLAPVSFDMNLSEQDKKERAKALMEVGMEGVYLRNPHMPDALPQDDKVHANLSVFTPDAITVVGDAKPAHFSDSVQKHSLMSLIKIAERYPLSNEWIKSNFPDLHKTLFDQKKPSESVDRMVQDFASGHDPDFIGLETGRVYKSSLASALSHRFGDKMRAEYATAIQPFAGSNPLTVSHQDRALQIATANLFALGLHPTGMNLPVVKSPLPMTGPPQISLSEANKASQHVSVPHFRDSLANSEGSFDRDGNSLPSKQSGGFMRLSRKQKNVLIGNPFLIVEAHAVPGTHGASEEFLVRFEYPSAKNYRSFENRLPPDLIQELKEAEKAGYAGSTGDTHSVPFKELTRKLVKELADSLTPSPTRPPSEMGCLEALSIRPFSDSEKNTKSLQNWMFCAQFSSIEPMEDLLFLDMPEIYMIQMHLKAKMRELQNSAQPPTVPDAVDAVCSGNQNIKMGGAQGCGNP